MHPRVKAAMDKSWMYLAIGVGAGMLLWLRRRLRVQPPAGARASAAAFTTSCAPAGAFVHIRDAGPQFIRDEDGGNWDEVDEASDESFPASDPPGFSLPKEIRRKEQR